MEERTIKFKPEITVPYLLSRVGEEEIFEAYGAPVVDYQFCSPLRTDKRPTCSFYRRRRDNRLILRDYSGHFWGDCFDYAIAKNPGKTFGNVLTDVAKRFALAEGETESLRTPLPPRVTISQVECQIRVKRTNWTISHYNYWKQYCITPETLELYKVSPLDLAWLNGQQVFSYAVKKEIAFCYYFGGYDYKLYFPNRPRGSMRFLHNNANILQGYEQLPERGDFCLDTKALKDIMSLHEFSVPAVSPMAESMIISETVQGELLGRFPRLFSLKDLDETGIRSMKAMRSRVVQPLFFPRNQPKDFSDFVKARGKTDAQHLVDYVRDYYSV